MLHVVDETPIVNIVVAVVVTLIAIAVIVIAVVCLHRKGKLIIHKTSGYVLLQEKLVLYTVVIRILILYL